MFCPACGQEAPENARFCPKCGQPLCCDTQGPSFSETEERCQTLVKYAGFWRRFVAYCLDGILVYILCTGAGAVVGYLLGMEVPIEWGFGGGKRSTGAAVGFIVVSVTSYLYWSLMESSPKQATVGKMALGLKVTDLRGAPISFGRATGRYFGKIISALLLGIGFLMAGWTWKKQALHDIMAGTLVVKKLDSFEPS